MKRPLVEALVALTLIVVCVAGRLLPHPPNFSPLAPAALFGGFFFASRWLAFGVPIAAMAISDALLGLEDPQIKATVYAALTFPVLLRFLYANGPSAARVVGGALTTSLFFFAVTNFAVWLWSGMYSLTLDGLALCYLAALPFLHYTLAGDLIWAAAFFGTYALVRGRFPSTAPLSAAGR